LIIRVLHFYQKLPFLAGPVSATFINFNQKHRPGTGFSTNSETGDSGCCNLEGGLMSLPEGLEVSARPCARVLSVAGFSAVLGRFPR